MARRKKQQKRTWFRALLLFVIVPVFTWVFAFFLWFYWYDLKHLFTPKRASRMAPQPARPSKTNEDRERPPMRAPQERLLDEERKQLEEILKRRG